MSYKSNRYEGTLSVNELRLRMHELASDSSKAIEDGCAVTLREMGAVRRRRMYVIEIDDDVVMPFNVEIGDAMSLDEYQDHANRTLAGASLPGLALGVAGEAGEVCDLVKKHIMQGHPLDKEKLAEEIGDVLWYLATMATTLGLSLGDIAGANVAKLRRRYPDGFSTAASMNRNEGKTT